MEKPSAPGGESAGYPRELVVGRDAELRRLGDLADTSVEQGAQVVFVSGEAGIGKSTLARHFLQRLKDHRWGVHSGQCIEYAERPIPFGPVIGLLRSVLDDAGEKAEAIMGHHRADLAALLPEWQTEGIDGAPLSGDVDRLIDAVSAVMRQATDDHPIALFVEDIHWVDAATRDLISSLVHSLGSARVLILISERTGSVPRGHVLRTWLAEQRRFPNVHSITLSGLTTEALSEQAEHILGEPPDANLIGQLVERTGGNAFFASELLLARRSGSDALPDSLADFLTSRIEQLESDEQEILRAMAIAGEAISHRLLGDVLAHLDLGPAIRRLFDASIVVIDDGKYTFSHALMREAILRSVLPFEAEDLHRCIAETIESDPQRGGSLSDLSTLATHWAGANDPARSLAAAVRAGEASAAVAAYETAAELAAHALRVWPTVDGAEALTGTTRDALAVTMSGWLSLADRFDEASKTLDAALQTWAYEIPDARRALLLAELAHTQFVAGTPEGTSELLDEAVSLVGDERTAEAAQVHYRVSKVALRRALIDEALAAAERTIDIGLGPEPILVDALTTKALGLGVTVGLQEGLDLVHESRRRAMASNLVSQVASTYRTEMSIIHFREGRTKQGLDIVRQGVRYANEHCGPNLRLDMLHHLALSLVEDGSLVEAEPLLDQLQTSRHDFRGVADLQTTSLHAILAGRLDEASTTLAKARSFAGSFDQAMGFQCRLEAEVFRRTGDLDAALASIDAALERQLAMDNITFTRESVLERCRLVRAIASVDPERAASLRSSTEHLLDRSIAPGQISNPLTELMRLELDLIDGPAPAATVRDLAVRLADAGFGADAKQAELIHVELLAAEQPGTPQLAKALEDLRALGKSSGMLWLSERADDLDETVDQEIDLTEVVDVRETPSAAPADDHGLTPREIEVLGMLAQGLTNKEIGSALFVSHRTISTHVSNLLSKLHLKNRSEAASKFHELGFSRIGS